MPTVIYRLQICNLQVIQRRVDGTMDFNKEWDDYLEGFGDAHNNYWIG